MTRTRGFASEASCPPVDVVLLGGRLDVPGAIHLTAFTMVKAFVRACSYASVQESAAICAINAISTSPHDPPRLLSQLEAAADFVVTQGLTNAQQHAGASRVVVQVRTDNDDLVVDVLDDAGGGADLAGSGLRGLSDRVEALGGSLTVESPPRGGTRLLARVPLGGASR
jgi:glucose-6-phosphate-specific signal transduction histidine kinase